MPVYQFEIWSRKIAVDVESGNYFGIDNASSEAIDFMANNTDEDTINYLGNKYGREKASRLVQNLSGLRKNNLIFSLPLPQENRIARKITDLTLNIVNKCNLRCRYCWNDAGSYGANTADAKKMDAATAFKAVDLLVKESGRYHNLVVDFYGGEPLLNFELIQRVVEYCQKVGKNKKIDFHFLLATNGTLMDKEKGDFLIGNGVDVAVSLDGPQKIQDRQRPFSDGKGTFETIINNINSLKKGYRGKVVGRATFTPYSKNVIETFNFLRKLGFERIEVCESEKAGYGLEANNQYFFQGSKGIETLKSLYSDLAWFYKDEIIKGRLTYENTYFNRFFKQLSRLYHIQSIVGSCSAGFSLMSVDMNGSIYPCTAFIGVGPCKIGNVASGIDERKLDKFLENKTFLGKSCVNCWAKKICRGCGSCYNLNYFSNRRLNQPDPYYCELFRHKTKLMMAMIDEISQKKPGILEKVLIPEYYSARGHRKKRSR